MISYSNKKIINVYALSLFEYVNENYKNNFSNNFYKEIKKFYSFLEKNFYLNRLFYDPRLRNDKKINIFEKIFASNSIIFRLIKLLILKNRLSIFKSILLEYINIYNEKINNIIECIIITAIPIRKNIQNMIVNQIISNKKKIHITNKIDPSIIGGFIFKKKYEELDCSVKNKINYINNQII